jgi:hypothetical protein
VLLGLAAAARSSAGITRKELARRRLIQGKWQAVALKGTGQRRGRGLAVRRTGRVAKGLRSRYGVMKGVRCMHMVGRTRLYLARVGLRPLRRCAAGLVFLYAGEGDDGRRRSTALHLPIALSAALAVRSCGVGRSTWPIGGRSRPPRRVGRYSSSSCT